MFQLEEIAKDLTFSDGVSIQINSDTMYLSIEEMQNVQCRSIDVILCESKRTLNFICQVCTGWTLPRHLESIYADLLVQPNPIASLAGKQNSAIFYRVDIIELFDCLKPFFRRVA